MNKQRKKWEIISPSPLHRQNVCSTMRWSHFHNYHLRKSMAELKTEPRCWYQRDCCISKAFFLTKSQRNESNSTQTATWGDLPPGKLSSGSALLLTPRRHCLCRGDSQVGQSSCWGKGVSLGTKGHGSCSRHCWQVNCDLRVTSALVLTHSMARHR